MSSIRLENGADKPTIVWVHGTGGNSHFLEPLAMLCKETNNLLIELPGHGDIDGNLSLESYLSTIREEIAGLANVILAGHSLGGTLVLSILSENLPNVKAGIVISSASAYTYLDAKLLDDAHRGEIDYDKFISYGGFPDNVDLNVIKSTLEPKQVIVKDLLIAEGIDVTDELSSIDVPVLVMVGGDDELAYPEYSEKIAIELKERILSKYEGYKHMLPLLNSAKVSSDIELFLTLYNLI